MWEEEEEREKNHATEKVIVKVLKMTSNLTFSTKNYPINRKTKKFSVSNYNFFLKMLYSCIIDHCAVHLHLSFKSLKIVLFSFRWEKKRQFPLHIDIIRIIQWNLKSFKRRKKLFLQSKPKCSCRSDVRYTLLYNEKVLFYRITFFQSTEFVFQFEWQKIDSSEPKVVL